MAGKSKRQNSRPSSPYGTRVSVEVPAGQQFGQMGLKSSAYASGSMKLTNQYIIRDRMNAHYKKLTHVKPAIDNAPPKSMLVSQKVRDQARREAAKYALKQQRSTLKPGRRNSFSEGDEISSEIASMMETLSHTELASRYSDYSLATKQSMEFGSAPGNGYSPDQKQRRPHSAGHQRTNGHISSDYYEDGLNSPSHRSQTRSARDKSATGGDILEIHNENFTESQPFQPRLLKSTRQSKLSQYKYYNPAPKKATKNKQEANGNNYQEKGDIVNGKKGDERKAPSLKATIRPGTAQTDNSDWMMNETIMSRNRDERDTPSEVPPLNISVDKDHQIWLKNQPAKKSNSQEQTPKPVQVELSLGQGTTLPHNRQSSTKLATTTTAGYFSYNPAVRELAREEEELKYLSFIKEVTNDVLDRGLFSNRVIMRIFENHIQNRKHELDERKMRLMLEDLKDDLGITEDKYENVPISYKHSQHQPKPTLTSTYGTGSASNNYGSPPRNSKPPVHKGPARNPTDTADSNMLRSSFESDATVLTSMNHTETADIMQLNHTAKHDSKQSTLERSVDYDVHNKHGQLTGARLEPSTSVDATQEYTKHLEKSLYDEENQEVSEEYDTDFDEGDDSDAEATGRNNETASPTARSNRTASPTPRNSTLSNITPLSSPKAGSDIARININARQRRRETQNHTGPSNSATESVEVSDLDDDQLSDF